MHRRIRRTYLNQLEKNLVLHQLFQSLYMNITATLFGQMIAFVIFVWFIKAYLWGPLTQAMEDRTNKISEGLASAELGEKKIEEAKIEYEKIVEDAKSKASDVINMAQQQSSNLIAVSYTHLRAHETKENHGCRHLLEK